MTRESDCHTADGTPKFTYLTKAEAKAVIRLKADLSQYQRAGTFLHVYRCPACRHYHIGHDVTDEGAAA